MELALYMRSGWHGAASDPCIERIDDADDDTLDVWRRRAASVVMLPGAPPQSTCRLEIDGVSDSAPLPPHYACDSCGRDVPLAETWTPHEGQEPHLASRYCDDCGPDGA